MNIICCCCGLPTQWHAYDRLKSKSIPCAVTVVNFGARGGGFHSEYISLAKFITDRVESFFCHSIVEHRAYLRLAVCIFFFSNTRWSRFNLAIVEMHSHLHESIDGAGNRKKQPPLTPKLIDFTARIDRKPERVKGAAGLRD